MSLRHRGLRNVLALGLALAPGFADASARLDGVGVTQDQNGVAVRLTMSGSPSYQAQLLGTPPRIVIDLEDTTYASDRNRVAVAPAPVAQVRGSQLRHGMVRVIIELTRLAPYGIRQAPGEIVVVFPITTTRNSPASAAIPPLTEAPPPEASPVGAPMTPPVPRGSVLGRWGTSTGPPKPPDARGAPAQPWHPSKPPALVAPRGTRGAPRYADTLLPAPPVAQPPSSPEVPPGAQRLSGAEVSAQRPSVAVVPPGAIPVPAGEPAAPGSQAPGPDTPSGSPTIQPPSSDASTPPINAGGRRLISLDFKDADVVNVLRILAAESGRNIVMSDDVKGKISIALRKVPWEQALDTILEAKGLEKIEREGVIRIVSSEQLQKEREAKDRSEEAKRKAEVELRAREAEARAKEIEARAKQQEAQRRRQQAEDEAKELAARGPLMEATIRLYYADADEVAKTLQGLLGIAAEDAARKKDVTAGPPVIPEPPFSALFGPPPAPSLPAPVPPEVFEKRLTIRAYKPTNTLFLRLYQSDIERIRTLIRESIDIPVPQVKIEARMEILDRSALEQIGVQWGGFVAQNAGSQTLVGQGFNPGDLLRGGIPVQGLSPANTALALSQGLPVSALTGLPLGGNIVNLPISTLPTQGPLPTTGIAFGIVGTNLNVNLALQALAEQGKTRTLARPEIVTVENSLASIELGEEIPYTTVSAAGTQIQFKKAALKLDVTPTVVNEVDYSKIRMTVIVENNSRGDVVNLGSAGTPPAINTRKAITQVLVKEGERLVIGGITRTEMRNNVRKVPVLGDIPILGALFRISENFEQGRELVVFLTPSVLRQAVPAKSLHPPR